ncbi:hypothetical protein NKH86_11215 [Mesorhizobium sp. M0913]|uniref:hypothetical protein n=1 Tax=Mesorhizobium sp. M0913 TaxID=2957026 RepID=UPI00333DA380
MSSFTVGDLREAIEGLPDTHELLFDGGLTFSRLKRWGDNSHVVIFRQVQAELYAKTRKTIQVAFAPAVESDDAVATITVPRL